MKVINNLLCKIFGHKWTPKSKYMYCIRCGVSRPKTFSEYLSYDSLFAKFFSEERYRKYIFNDLQQLHEISQKQYKGDLKDIGDTVYIKEFGDLNK